MRSIHQSRRAGGLRVGVRGLGLGLKDGGSVWVDWPDSRTADVDVPFASKEVLLDVPVAPLSFGYAVADV